MNCLVMFGGQGSQVAAMGRDFYECEPSARKIYNQAFERYPHLSEILDQNFTRIDETRYAQPAILLFSQVVVELLREQNILPAGAIGLSAGEYAALFALGSWTGEQSLAVIDGRAELMAQRLQSRRQSGYRDGMMAVLGLSEDEIFACLVQAEATERVYLSNLNDDKQFVLGGDVRRLKELEPHIHAAGARRCVFLDVEGAFHTPVFAPDVAALAQLLQTLPPRLPQGYMPFNYSGRALSETDTEADLIGMMARQMASPVRLNDCLKQVIGQKFDLYLEISAKPVLQPILRRRDRALKTAVISNYRDLLDFLAVESER